MSNNGPRTEFLAPNTIIKDDDPDERGNVMLAATVKDSERIIALQFNAN